MGLLSTRCSGGRLPAERVIDSLWSKADIDVGRNRLRTVLNRSRAEAGDVALHYGEVLSPAAEHQRRPAQLTREIARAHRAATPLVVAFVDVDGLKGINDARGHAAGDAVLVAVARALQRELRVYDVIFRCGDDEIVRALPG